MDITRDIWRRDGDGRELDGRELAERLAKLGVYESAELAGKAIAGAGLGSCINTGVSSYELIGRYVGEATPCPHPRVGEELRPGDLVQLSTWHTGKGWRDMAILGRVERLTRKRIMVRFNHTGGALAARVRAYSRDSRHGESMAGVPGGPFVVVKR